MECFDLDGRVYNVIKLFRIRIGWYTISWTNLRDIWNNAERLQVWTVK